MLNRSTYVHVFDKSLEKRKPRRYRVAVFYCWALQNTTAVSSHGSCVPGLALALSIGNNAIDCFLWCLAPNTLQLLTVIDNFLFT